MSLNLNELEAAVDGLEKCGDTVMFLRIEKVRSLIELVREMGEAMQRDVDGQIEENIEVLDCVKAALAKYKELTK